MQNSPQKIPFLKAIIKAQASLKLIAILLSLECCVYRSVPSYPTRELIFSWRGTHASVTLSRIKVIGLQRWLPSKEHLLL